MSDDECKDGEHCASTGTNNSPVSEKLCQSRRETMTEKIESEVKSVKEAVYLTGIILGIVFAVISFIRK